MANLNTKKEEIVVNQNLSTSDPNALYVVDENGRDLLIPYSNIQGFELLITTIAFKH